jgi:hypothetical protein
MRSLATKLVFGTLMLGLAAGGPALAATKKPMAHHGKMATPTAEQVTTDQLNSQSLMAAQQGKAFMPGGSAAPATPAPAPAAPPAAPKKM